MANRHFNLRTISTFANGNNEEYMTVYYVRPSFAPTCFFFSTDSLLFRALHFRLLLLWQQSTAVAAALSVAKQQRKKKYIEKP